MRVDGHRCFTWLLALVIGACAPMTASVPPDQEPAAAPEAIVLAPGQAARVDGTSLTITFESVSEDSRCPEGVNCVWAGDVSVTLRIEGGTEPPRSATLHLNLPDRDAVHGEHRVTLVDVTPHPSVDEKVEPERYRATLRVTKK